MTVEKQKDLSASIILNVYNAEKLIETFLTQLLQQTYQAFELVVVDDGSTDATVQLAQGFQSRFQNLKVERIAHAGLSAARARGLEVASGEICIILDVDEIIEDPDLIVKFIEPFQDPTIAAVGGSIRPFGTGWLVEAQRLDRKFRQRMRKTGKDGQSWLVMGGVMALRRAAVMSVGGMSTNRFVVEDTDLSMKLKKSGWKLIVREDIVVGHPDPNTISGVFKRSLRMGERIAYILREHPEVALNARFLLAYTPLWVLLTALVSWKLALVLVLLSFVVIQVMYARIPSTFLSRVSGWVLLWLNGFGIAVGSLIGAFKMARARLAGGSPA